MVFLNSLLTRRKKVVVNRPTPSRLTAFIFNLFSIQRDTSACPPQIWFIHSAVRSFEFMINALIFLLYRCIRVSGLYNHRAAGIGWDQYHSACQELQQHGEARAGDKALAAQGSRSRSDRGLVRRCFGHCRPTEEFRYRRECLVRYKHTLLTSRQNCKHTV
jgi:hypothetical protein